MTEIAETYGVTGIQLGALYTISENQVTMGKVAQMLHCDASNATGIVDRLVALGLVTRRESLQDRRIKILEATAKGRKIIDEVQAELPRRLSCIELSKAECDMIHALAAKFAIKPL
jgi:DNA-binding MarR family transcriptional regulator